MVLIGLNKNGQNSFSQFIPCSIKQKMFWPGRKVWISWSKSNRKDWNLECVSCHWNEVCIVHCVLCVYESESTSSLLPPSPSQAGYFPSWSRVGVLLVIKLRIERTFYCVRSFYILHHKCSL